MILQLCPSLLESKPHNPCCFAFGRCVHKAGLVWTDLKLDNMLLCERDEARAIDLEGAVPARSAPKSYTPDTMPPDFAVASRGGVSPFLISIGVTRQLCCYPKRP